jgi:hypothetical protein
VALSTVRTVLDPERRFPPDSFVGADRHAVWLADLPVDVDEFLATARAGLAASARGEADQALALLTSAEVAYAGDFLEEDRYEDWAVALRDEEAHSSRSPAGLNVVLLGRGGVRWGHVDDDATAHDGLGAHQARRDVVLEPGADQRGDGVQVFWLLVPQDADRSALLGQDILEAAEPRVL